MEESERSSVAIFVQRTMHERYGSDAYALPGIVFAAWDRGDLVGAIGLSLSSGEAFSLEKTYALDYKTFPGVFERTKIVELGRWAVKVQDLSEALVYTAILHALGKRREWGIGEVKPQVARRFAQMGIRVTTLSGEPILRNIPAGVLPYYLLSPRPLPRAMGLTNAEQALREKIMKLITEGMITLKPF